MAEVAKRLETTTHILYSWLKKYKLPQPYTNEQTEIALLKAELRRDTEGRDILKKAAAYFAGSTNKVSLYQRLRQGAFGTADVSCIKSSSHWLL